MELQSDIFCLDFNRTVKRPFFGAKYKKQNGYSGY